MRNTKKAFTLVELIVVITILAILGTIAFISLQGYSQDAKNSKVTSDLRTIVSAVETGITKGTFTLATAIDTTNTIDSTATYTGSSYDLASGTASYRDSSDSWAQVADLTASGTYNVWMIDFAAIGQNGTDFKDNDDNNYIAASWSYSTTAYYQLAGQTKNSAGNYSAVVKGNYIPQTGDVEGLIVDRTGDDTNWVEDGDDLGLTDLY